MAWRCSGAKERRGNIQRPKELSAYKWIYIAADSRVNWLVIFSIERWPAPSLYILCILMLECGVVRAYAIIYQPGFLSHVCI